MFVYNGYYSAWVNATGVQGEQGSAFLFSHLDLFVVPIALLVGGWLMYFVVSMWVANKVVVIDEVRWQFRKCLA